MKKIFISLLVLSFSPDSFTQSWNPVGTGTNGFIVNAVELDSVTHDLYLGGSFTLAGGTPSLYITRWNGTNFSPLGNGGDNPVRSLEFIGAELWAGGEFTIMDSATSPCIARWNGSVWQNVGSGFEKNGMHTAAATVYAIAEYNGDVYAGGVFDTADSVQCLYIARWDGVSWNPLGTGIAGISWVYDMQVYNGFLYVAGSFVSAGGVSNTANIAKWDGSSWSAAGGSADAPVFSLHLHNGQLFAAGAFDNIGGVAASKIARWSDFSWAPLGLGLDVDATSMASFEGELYAGGIFTTAGGAPASRVARWDDANWSAVGSGTNGLVMDLEPDAQWQRLYAAGSFSTAGGNTANHVAYWTSVVSVEDPHIYSPSVVTFPNPVSEQLVVRTEAGWISGNGKMIITDASGREHFSMEGMDGAEWAVDVSRWADGIYLISLQDDGMNWMGKFVINKN